MASLFPTCSKNCDSCTSDRNELLAGLDIEHRRDLDAHKSHIHFHREEYIFKQGVYPSGLYCLRRGHVMLTKSDDSGGSIVVNLHKEVTFLGIADFISQSSYQYNCIALSEVEVCFLKKEQIDAFMSKNGGFSNRLLKEIATQYHQANQRLLDIAKKNMNARLASALCELIEVYGLDNDRYLNAYLKRSELAMLSNMSIANCIRHLSGFQKMKLLSIEGKKIKIQDSERLKWESLLV